MGVRRLQYSVTELFALWGSGASYDAIAAAIGCNVGTVQKLKERHKLPNRKRQTNTEFKPADDPTPEQIAERARECREAHYAKRRRETAVETDSRLSKERARRRCERLRARTASQAC